MSLVCLYSANCLQAFLCIIFRRGFLLGQQPCRPIWCSVRCMVWALTGCLPTPSISAAMLAALMRLFPKHNFWIWLWALALNFVGRQWRGLFWVEPVLLKRCMALATVLQLSCRVLAIFFIAYAIFMYSNNYFFQILREFFAMRCHVELPVTSMREWDQLHQI